jgi:cytosine/uracil/thiamine/allantoin permease
MFLWSAVYLSIEAWFLHKFFIDIDLYYYEILAIIDQGIFTIGLVFYLTKEAQNGKRKD